MWAVFNSINTGAEVGLLAEIYCRSYGDKAGTTALSIFGQHRFIIVAQALGAYGKHQWTCSSRGRITSR